MNTIVHGTNEYAYRRAIKEGLQPRKRKRKSRWKSMPSNPNAVYLSQAYGLYYARNAAGTGRNVLIEIDMDVLDQLNLVADEDALEQVFRHHEEFQEKFAGMDMRKRTFWCRNNATAFKTEGYGFEWSLNAIGNCAHLGPIPQEAFLRAAMFHDHDCPELYYQFDPTMSTINYAIMGEIYCLLQKLIMGYELTESEWENYLSMTDEEYRQEKRDRLERELEKVSIILPENREAA